MTPSPWSSWTWRFQNSNKNARSRREPQKSKPSPNHPQITPPGIACPNSFTAFTSAFPTQPNSQRWFQNVHFLAEKIRKVWFAAISFCCLAEISHPEKNCSPFHEKKSQAENMCKFPSHNAQSLLVSRDPVPELVSWENDMPAALLANHAHLQCHRSWRSKRMIRS